MLRYIHELPDWPAFRWDAEALAPALAQVHAAQAHLLGRMAAVGFELRTEANFETMATDVLRTSEIEGELLDPAQVRSSLAMRLGLDVSGTPKVDRHVDGVVEMLLDEESTHLAGLSEFIGKPISLSAEPTMNPEQYDIVLM